MRRQRRPDEPDTIELLLRMALEEITPAEFDYLMVVAGRHINFVFGEQQEATGLEMPSDAVVRGACELALWDTIDFIRELTGLNAVDERERRVARQTFRIDVYLQDHNAQAIRKYVTLAVEHATWRLIAYRLIENRQ
jgi:hypothetical protein